MRQVPPNGAELVLRQVPIVVGRQPLLDPGARRRTAQADSDNLNHIVQVYSHLRM